MKRLSWGLGLCVFAMLMMVVTHVYFTFVFHPAYLKETGAVSEQLFDVEGWIAFARSTAGIVLNVMWILPMIAAAALFITAELPGEQTIN